MLPRNRLLMLVPSLTSRFRTSCRSDDLERKRFAGKILLRRTDRSAACSMALTDLANTAARSQPRALVNAQNTIVFSHAPSHRFRLRCHLARRPDLPAGGTDASYRRRDAIGQENRV